MASTPSQMNNNENLTPQLKTWPGLVMVNSKQEGKRLTGDKAGWLAPASVGPPWTVTMKAAVAIIRPSHKESLRWGFHGSKRRQPFRGARPSHSWLRSQDGEGGQVRVNFQHMLTKGEYTIGNKTIPHRAELGQAPRVRRKREHVGHKTEHNMLSSRAVYGATQEYTSVLPPSRTRDRGRQNGAQNHLTTQMFPFNFAVAVAKGQPPQPNLKMGSSDHKHKSSSSRHQHDGTKHDKDVHIGHSKPKDKKKGSSSDNVRWICSYCNAGNLSYNYDASCPFCFTARGSGVSTYTP
ncbi:hypothetical protein PG997_011028 [Apiospora hydei]|uniref:RanBP2-type domain-containing protein n=1 Tax=Apiospora hydei TaxID=1337664 RepID=A0ABR1VHW7_9PEZI